MEREKKERKPRVKFSRETKLTVMKELQTHTVKELA